jgi:heat shock protein HslJ
MLKKWKYICGFLPLLVLLMIGGCGSHEVPALDTASVQKELFGKNWKLQSLFTRDVNSEVPLTLEFMEDGTVKGFGGCNNFSGKYTLDGEAITFGPMISTKKACGPAMGEQEYTFLTFLAQINRLKIADDNLELYSDQQIVPMVLTTGSGGFLW